MQILKDIGSYAGLGAVVGLAVLSALYFSQARDVKRLREWAGRAPERTSEGTAAQQIAPQRVTAVPQAKPAAAGQKPAQPAAAQPGAAKPAAVPAAAAAAGAATPQARPAAATPAAQGKTPAAATAQAKPGDAAAADDKKLPVAAEAKDKVAEEKKSSETEDTEQPAAEANKPAEERQPAAVGAPAAQGAAAASGEAKTAQPSASAGTGTAAPVKPADGAGAGDGPATPAPGTPAAPTAPAKPAAVTPAGTRPGQSDPPPVPRTPPPKRPIPSLPARAAPETPSPGPSQTAILPPYGQEQQSWYRRLLANPRYLVLAIVGVLVVGGAAAFGLTELSKKEAPPPRHPQAATNDTPKKTTKQKKAAPINPRNVTVSVLNGTTVPGLAAQIGDRVTALGFQLGNVTNSSDQQRAESVVLFAPGAQREAAFVGRKLGIAQREPIDPQSQTLAGDARLVVITGADKTR